MKEEKKSTAPALHAPQPKNLQFIFVGKMVSKKFCAKFSG